MADGFGIFQPWIDLATHPIGLILIAIVTIALIYHFFFRKGPEDKFEIERFEDKVAEDIDKKFKLKGIPVKGTLMQGFDFLGRVDMWLRMRGAHVPLTYDDKKGRFVETFEKKTIKGKAVKSPVKTPYDVYIFRIRKGNALSRALRLSKNIYALVEANHLSNFDVSKGFRTWNLKPHVEFKIWGGMYITSESAEEIISDIAIKRSHENTLTFLMNYARKIIYLELRHAKRLDRYRTAKEIEAKNWSDYKTGGPEEESEDDEG